MSAANIAVLKNMFDRFKANDGPGVLDLFTDDVQFDHRGPAGPAFNRLYEGREAVGRFLADLAAAEEAILLEDREYFGAGDRVVCLGFMRFRALQTGNEWESDFAMTVTVRGDHQMSQWRIFFDMGKEADALNA